MKLGFIKMHGCGNDFLIHDSMNSNPSTFFPSEIQFLCDRNFGIGADGLVILYSGIEAEAKWDFFNSDGSEASMCGNAIRCVIKYLLDYHFPKNEVVGVETKSGIIRGRKLPSGLIEVTLMPNRNFEFDYTEKVIEIDNEIFQTYNIRLGVPHAVIEVDEMSSFPIDRIGRSIMEHDYYKPEKTNVTFFQRLLRNQIMSTTFERGVNKQTLACGSGAASAALIYSQLYMESLPIEVKVPGGTLYVDISPATQYLLLQGPADYVFNVEIEDLVRNFEPVKLYGV